MNDYFLKNAYAFVTRLIKSAKKSIVLMDNYVDESVLLMLAKRNVYIISFLNR